MTQFKDELVQSETTAAGDAEALSYFSKALAEGQHWYLALLGSIGLWASAAENHGKRSYKYLIGGEAFDWLLLAERLCETAGGILPEAETDAMLMHGIPPLRLNAGEVRQLIGEKKYCQYLNFFYGVTVEEALVLAVQEEIDKERRANGLRSKRESADDAYLRVYDTSKEQLLDQFRQEKSYPRHKSISLSEMKEFTYWCFKYRLKQSEKARIASDTKKALDFLKRQWQKKGISKVLATEFEGFREQGF